MTTHHNIRKASFTKNMPDRMSALAMGPLEFSRLGADKTVYIKSLKSAEGVTLGYGIYAVDGSRLSVQQTYNDAVVTAHLNDFDPEMLN